MQYLEGDNRFYVPGADGGADAAEITFTRIGEHLASIDHTFVDINFRRQGIGEHLVRLVVDKMRAEGRKILPNCSFAQREFERVADYNDIWAKND